MPLRSFRRPWMEKEIKWGRFHTFKLHFSWSELKKTLAQTPNSPDGCQQVLVLAKNVLQESLFKLCDLAGLHLIQMTSDTSVNDRDLLLNGHRGWKGQFNGQSSTTFTVLWLIVVKRFKWTLTVLSLFQQLSQSNAPVQELLGSGVQIRSELGEGGDFTVLSQLQFHGTSHLHDASAIRIIILVFGEEITVKPQGSNLTCFMALVWAADPTLDTDRPTLIAGRIPL